MKGERIPTVTSHSKKRDRNKNGTCLSLWFWQWLIFSDFLRSHFWTNHCSHVPKIVRGTLWIAVQRWDILISKNISLPCLHVQVPCIGISPFGRGAQQQPTFVDFTSVCSWGAIPELNGGSIGGRLLINGWLSSKLCFEYQRVSSICFFPTTNAILPWFVSWLASWLVDPLLGRTKSWGLVSHLFPIIICNNLGIRYTPFLDIHIKGAWGVMGLFWMFNPINTWDLHGIYCILGKYDFSTMHCCTKNTRLWTYERQKKNVLHQIGGNSTQAWPNGCWGFPTPGTRQKEPST